MIKATQQLIMQWYKLAISSTKNMIFSILIIGSVAFSVVKILEAKAKSNCENCKPYKDISESLLEALKKSPSPTTSSTGYKQHIESINYQFAVYYDTIPPKQMTQTQWDKYKDSLIKVTQRKLDSLSKKKN